jgi:3-hydroxymyristoyl/3-hydroxydecanoyl-(acyl carrier protein) dehydratase
MSKLTREICACMSHLNTDAESLTARFCFPEDFIGFKGHFPNHPVVPGVCKIQAILCMLAAQGRVPVLPLEQGAAQQRAPAPQIGQGAAQQRAPAPPIGQGAAQQRAPAHPIGPGTKQQRAPAIPKLREIVSAKFFSPVTCNQELDFAVRQFPEGSEAVLIKALITHKGKKIADIHLRIVFEPQER